MTLNSTEDIYMTTQFRSSAWIVVALAGLVPAAGAAQTAVAPSAPISDVQYDVTYDASTAPLRQIAVAMSFRTSSSEPVVLSLPAWTPGSYELDNYARNIRDFSATASGQEIRWDKVDYDSWRVYPDGAREVTVGFNYRADNLDTGNSWSATEFAYFNGTNLFFFAEGQSLEFPARVNIHTEPGWQIATGLTCEGTPGEYTAADFHEVVDMPTFIGRFDLDSMVIDGVIHRLATYPAGFVAGESRELIWSQIEGMMPPMAAVFGEYPFESYTTLMVLDEEYPGASALEHRNSHLGIYMAGGIGNPMMMQMLSSVTSHEIFHAWNVKRLRPVELVPYAYGVEQPTTLLWVSEGVTSYYDDLLLVRGGVADREFFYQSTVGQINNVRNVPAVALEDASLSTWIGPTDGTGGIYYAKGALAGFMLDILIRDATDNDASLDNVMRELYRETYKKDFTGFSEQDWWDAVSRAAGGKSFEEFWARYIDGRDPYPWEEVLPLAGLVFNEDTTRRPLVGIYPAEDSLGVRIGGLVPGGAAADGGVQEGDYLVSAGPVEISTGDSFDEFRAYFSQQPVGSMYEVVVRRGEEMLTLELELRLAEEVERSITEDPDASEKAARIRESLFTSN
jgi:predicted metalloprotease with PDZ domain